MLLLSNVETATSVKMQIAEYYTGYPVLVSALKYFHPSKRSVMKIGMRDIKLRTPRREFILTGAVSHRVFYVP